MKVQRKRVVIDAYQFDGKELPPGASSDDGGCFVDTLEGKRHLSPGDWVLIGSSGEKYVCSSEEFLANYEPVPEEPKP